MRKKKTTKQGSQGRTAIFYRQDIAGLWLFLKIDDNELLLTSQPIINPGDIEKIKSYCEGE